ncbi:hypothetical protein MXD95_019485 [Frankia sp. AiPa1]|nr:hypothetical protein [Frankia sp. AiPa1]
MLDTTDLSDIAAARLRELAALAVEQLSPDPDGPSTAASRQVGADRFTYLLEISWSGQHAELTVAEPVPVAIRPLLEVLKQAPGSPAAGPQPGGNNRGGPPARP